jgi:hypothetical protein
VNLGNVLKQASGTPITGRHVAFTFIVIDKDKNRSLVDAEALLFPVDEKQRAEVRAAAKDWCLEVDEQEGSATFGKRLRPDADYGDELTYRFFLRVLRDTEDPRKPWATDEQLPLLRTGFVQQQFVWLGQEYAAYLKDEYKELAGIGATDADAARVKEQASFFTGAAPQSPSK